MVKKNELIRKADFQPWIVALQKIVKEKEFFLYLASLFEKSHASAVMEFLADFQIIDFSFKQTNPEVVPDVKFELENGNWLQISETNIDTSDAISLPLKELIKVLVENYSRFSATVKATPEITHHQHSYSVERVNQTLQEILPEVEFRTTATKVIEKLGKVQFRLYTALKRKKLFEPGLGENNWLGPKTKRKSRQTIEEISIFVRKGFDLYLTSWFVESILSHQDENVETWKEQNLTRNYNDQPITYDFKGFGQSHFNNLRAALLKLHTQQYN